MSGENSAPMLEEEKIEEKTEEKTAENYVANNEVMVRPIILKRQYEFYALLPQRFSKFGLVTRIQILRDADGQYPIIRQHKDWNRPDCSVGIAYLTMQSNIDANEVAAEFDGKSIDDTNVHVKAVAPKT